MVLMGSLNTIRRGDVKSEGSAGEPVESRSSGVSERRKIA